MAVFVLAKGHLLDGEVVAVFSSFEAAKDFSGSATAFAEWEKDRWMSPISTTSFCWSIAKVPTDPPIPERKAVNAVSPFAWWVPA